MADKDIEMQAQPSTETDKVKSRSEAVEDRAPTPPVRENKGQDSVMVSEPDSKQKRFSGFQRPEFVRKPEKDGSCMTVLKNLLIFFNLLIWLFGTALLGLGIWVNVDKEFWEIQTGLDMQKFMHAGVIFIVAGVIIMIIGFLGCYGAIALKFWMLIVYSLILILIIMLEIAVMVVVWTAINNKDVQEELKRRARKALQESAEKDSQRYLIDLLQVKLQCCGIEGPDDYMGSLIPRSCNNPETGYANTQGCLSKVVKYFKAKADILGGIAIAVFILQVAAFAITLCIACGLKQATKFY